MPLSITLSSLVPDASDLLALELEEVAGVLLTFLNGCFKEGGSSTVVQQGLISKQNLFNDLDRRPQYPGRQVEVSQALMEAWSWLERESFLVRDAHQPAEWFFLSRRALLMQTREDLAAYRKASLLPKGQLHPFIANRVYPAFLRGEYDTAVFQAFREIEIAVRTRGNFPSETIGVSLMREAFRPSDPKKPSIPPGPLTDTTLPTAEQEGMANLFSGAIGLYKNPQSHRNVPTEAAEAAELIVFASHLLRMVGRLREKPLRE